MRDCLIVHGMHRSGTSAFAGAAHVLGAGLPDDLMPASPFNPRGHFEPLWLVETNDALMASVGRDWRDSRALPEALRDGMGLERDEMAVRIRLDFGTAPLIVLKDPRIGLLAPLWEDVVRRTGRQVAHLLCLRAPEAVAASLARRDAMSADDGLALWLRHMLSAERDTRGKRRVMMRIEALVADPADTMTKVGRALQLDWPRSPQAEAAALRAFVTKDLLHEAAPLTDALPELLALARRAYDLLVQVAQADEPEAWAELDDIHAALDDVAPLSSLIGQPGLEDEEKLRLIATAKERQTDRIAAGLSRTEAVALSWLDGLERREHDRIAAESQRNGMARNMAELAALTRQPGMLWRHLMVQMLCQWLSRVPVLSKARREHFARMALRRDLTRLTRPADALVTYGRLAGPLGRWVVEEAERQRGGGDAGLAVARPLPRLAVVVHCFYPDVLSHILDRLALGWQANWLLYVTCPPDLAAVVTALTAGFEGSFVLPLPNSGRDVRPFFSILPKVLADGAEVILKVHTKKSPHRQDGLVWRNRLLQELLDPLTIRTALLRFAADEGLGVVAPRGHVLRLPEFVMQNRDGLRHLATRARIDVEQALAGHFVAGTMMYLRAAPLAELHALIELDRFEPEAGQLDGTYAHAIERFFVTFLRAAGFGMTDTTFAETDADDLANPGWT